MEITLDSSLKKRANSVVKLRAIHLLNRMERIERDLSEISTLRSTLQDDREYTSRLRTSLQDETVRLRELQSKILTQVIANPPGSLARAAESGATSVRSTPAAAAPPADDPEILRAPEIIVPASKAGPARESKSSARSAKNKGGNAGPGEGAKGARKAKPDEAPDESFNFTFVQK